LHGDTTELSRAAQAYGHGLSPYRAQALEDASVVLAGSGHVRPARESHQSAVETYTELGATLDIRRADLRLMALGVRTSGRKARRRTITGWEALSQTEIKIATLVAADYSNPAIAARLFISRSTVESHVSNILTKLDVHSRIDIINRWLQLHRRVTDTGGRMRPK
jgi:DNA-binding NarL/FixJ family response regulator